MVVRAKPARDVGMGQDLKVHGEKCASTCTHLVLDIMHYIATYHFNWYDLHVQYMYYKNVLLLYSINASQDTTVSSHFND